MRRKIIEKLLVWKNKGAKRMPLLLHGARQVGKTYALKEFGERYYKNVAYVNLETNFLVASYFADDITPERIIRYLESATGETIVPNETLIILDEIQISERALTSLKYFREEAPEYHVACAGSLLGVAINREKYSFPVGNVDSITMYPFDFEEFLWANGKDKLGEEIRNSFSDDKALPEGLHAAAIDLYKLYLIIGGMPAVVREYVQTKKLVEVPDVQSKILSDYIADMSKYTSNTESVKIRAAYNSIPNQLAKDNKKYQYKVVQKGGNASMFGEAIEWLNFAGVVQKCQKTEQGIMPISVYSDLSSFKLYMGDVGLLTTKSGVSHQTILSIMEIDNIFLGAIAENYVACALAANGHQLYYWTSKNTAEVDFILQIEDDIIPVEVKSGKRTSGKSIRIFMDTYKSKTAIRISNKNFGFENGIKSVPLYAVFCISK